MPHSPIFISLAEFGSSSVGTKKRMRSSAALALLALAVPADGLSLDKKPALTRALQLRGGVTAGDAAYYGTMALNVAVGPGAALAPVR